MNRLQFRMDYRLGNLRDRVLGVLPFSVLGRPDVLQRTIFNKYEVTPERVISNFLQGLQLLGKMNGEEIQWRSFPERAVITPESARVRRSLRKYMNREEFEIRINTRPEQVIRNCRRESGTWINESIVEIYTRLAEMGYVSSLEAWQDGKLCGGNWGISIGRCYSIMSMYHEVSSSGSFVTGHLVDALAEGRLELVDCGGLTDNFSRFGAFEVPVERFVEKVVHAIQPRNGQSFEQTFREYLIQRIGEESDVER